MDLPQREIPPIQIRCPSCGQKFSVGHELKGRVAECGSCEQQFRITDEVILKGHRFYPAKKSGAELHRFQRAELSRNLPMATVDYGKKPDPAHFEPASPQRVLAGIFGVVFIIAVAALLMGGARYGGLLDGTPFAGRIGIALFAAIMGSTLLIYANPKARWRSAAVSALFSAGLMAIPFFFTQGSGASQGRDEIVNTAPVASDVEEKDQSLTELKRAIGTVPLETEIARLKAANDERHAVGLWIKNLRESNRLIVRDFVIRTCDADPSSHLYPRDRGNYLMVVTSAKDIQEMATVCSRLGRIDGIYPELQVIELSLDNDNFSEGPTAKLTAKEDPDFYVLNQRELESIDLTRVEKAVKRLADAEPRLLREDITRRLIALLGMRDVKFYDSVCRALVVWSTGDGRASEAAMPLLKELTASHREVPRDLIGLMVKEKHTEALPYLDELWFQDASRWESYYADMGPVAEETLLARFPETKGTIRHSAARILGKIGGAASVKTLEQARGDAEAELVILIDNALEAIKRRNDRI